MGPKQNLKVTLLVNLGRLVFQIRPSFSRAYLSMKMCTWQMWTGPPSQKDIGPLWIVVGAVPRTRAEIVNGLALQVEERRFGRADWSGTVKQKKFKFDF